MAMVVVHLPLKLQILIKLINHCLKDFLKRQLFRTFMKWQRNNILRKMRVRKDLWFYNITKLWWKITFLICYFLSAVSDVSLKLSELFDVDTLYSVILLANDSGLGVKFCSVFISIINLLSSDKFCSVSEALLANDIYVSEDSESEFDPRSEVKSQSSEVRLSSHFWYLR